MHETIPQGARSAPLQIVNPAEDVPRLLTGNVKLKGGRQIVLMLRPWSHGGLCIVAQGDVAHRFSPPAGFDAPVLSWEDPPPPQAWYGRDPASLAEAAKDIKEERGAIPKGVRAITLRGTWKGRMHVAPDGAPIVELERRISSYLRLHLVSGPKGWAWTADRDPRWFGGAHQERGVEPTLAEAIQQGVAAATGAVREACGARDTLRRGGLDPEWAKAHCTGEKPSSQCVLPTRERRDPLERFGASTGKARAPKASGGGEGRGDVSAPHAPSDAAPEGCACQAGGEGETSAPARTRAPRAPRSAAAPVAPEASPDTDLDRELLRLVSESIQQAVQAAV